MDQILKKEIFPFQYVGGGYFRRSGTPKGETAEILHGSEAISFVLREINKLIEKEQNK